MKKILTLLLLSILMIGCNEEEMVSNEEISSKIITEDKEVTEMLRFESTEELNSFIKERLETDLLEEARELAYSGNYTPLLLVYNLEAKEAEELGVNEAEVAKVETNDDMLLFLLNEKGEIGIKGKIYRIDGEFVYSYTSGYSGEIDQFIKVYDNGEIEIKKGETLNVSENLTIYRHNNNEVDKDVKAKGQTNYQYFSGDYRMKARQFNGFWGFYSSIGANTKVEKRKKVLWWTSWGTVATYNRLEYDMSYRVDSNFGFPTLIKKASGGTYPYANQAQKLYSWSVGVPVAPEVYTPLDGETRHWAHWYTTSTNTVSVTLNY